MLSRTVTLTAAQIAALCDGRVEGNEEREIAGANSLDEATANDLSFVASSASFDGALASQAGCLLVRHDFPHVGPWSLIRVDEPRASFAKALTHLYPGPERKSFRHPTAVIDESTQIGPDVTIGAFTVIGCDVTIGSGCTIGAGCYIADQVSVGADSILHANVTIHTRVQVGARAILHSGCVIGADGFGFARVGDGYQKFPQVGTVVIGDDVELGANTCVDRAALGRTVIGDGCKIDNLVHIAHNVKVGRNVVIAAQTGFSGGVVVGDDAVIGGQVGVGDKAQIDARAVVGSGSGILTKARVRAGEPVWGTPARPLRQHLKGLAEVGRLERSRKDWQVLRAKMEELERELKRADVRKETEHQPEKLQG